MNSSDYDLTDGEKNIGITPPHLLIGKETAWKRLELTGNRPPVTRKEYYKMEGVFSSANVTPSPYGKTTPRKRSELLGTRRDSCKTGECAESDAYG